MALSFHDENDADGCINWIRFGEEVNRHIKTHILILIEMFVNVAFLRISKKEIIILFEHLLEVLTLRFC